MGIIRRQGLVELQRAGILKGAASFGCGPIFSDRSDTGGGSTLMVKPNPVGSAF